MLLAGDVALNPGPTTPLHDYTTSRLHHFTTTPLHDYTTSRLHHFTTTPLHDLRIGSINVRSVREKGPLLHDLIVSKSLDILAVTETWLRANDTSAFLSDLTPPGFSFLHVPRHGRPGGGVGLFISDALSFSQITLPHQSSIEAICCTVATSPGTSRFTILNLYRPPGSDTVFFDEFQNILSSLTTTCQKLVITGDFNIHIDTSSHCTKVFHDILSSFDLQQLVSFPTPSHGHTLDLLIASSACTLDLSSSLTASPTISL